MSFSWEFGSKVNQETESLGERLSRLHLQPEIKQRASKFGLDIVTTSWEDTGRSKNSCWGPNISDMTLNVGDHNMSMIRKPNYGDITCDMPIDNFFLTVGNETKDAALKRISLKDFLRDIALYTDNKVKSMLLDRDGEILTSAQACVLPATKDGSVEFNVQLFNYQYAKDDPSVLVIVCSRNGTSCQVITEYHQKLYFNEAGMAANFVATGLTQHRKTQGITNADDLRKNMNQEEKEQNVLQIFQIPLKQKPRPQSRGEVYLCSMSMGSCRKSGGNFEDAILSTGTAHSVFKGTQGLTLERDDRYPIRCTLQFYKISDIVDVPEKEFELIGDKINRVYHKADVYGSLVVDGSTKRLTEANLPDYEVVPEIVKKTINCQEARLKPMFSG